MPPKKRAEWTEQNLRQALQAVRNGMSIKRSAEQYGIPRTTLGLHFRKNNFNKKLGRTPVLTVNQENELVQRIHRLAEVGFPVTSRVLMKSVYSYVTSKGIPNPFSKISKRAGRKWLNKFFVRHPDVAKRRAQQMNPARAQKMNRFIVNDYFQKLKEVMTKLELFDKPGNIYNMDEKGCRLTLHKQQVVLAKKGAKRVHLTAPEHGENVTIVGCGNALGQAVPPFVLFKGQRLKPEWEDHLPPGSRAVVTKKGSMTQETFISWLQHFSSFKNCGPTLLIFDGARCHLDISIAETAENLGITLFCLPSNTTHELQPMDKAVFKSFESFWEDEVLNFITSNPGKPITKMRFGEIFTKVWFKAMTPRNITSGFRGTGIYPYYPDVIPESAFAPSLITQQEQCREENEDNVSPEEKNDNQHQNKENRSPNIIRDQPSTSGYTKQEKNIGNKTKKRGTISSDSESSSNYSVRDNSSGEISSDDEALLTLISVPKHMNKEQIVASRKKANTNVTPITGTLPFKDKESSRNKIVTRQKEVNSNVSPETETKNSSFKDEGLLITPEVKVASTKRKPAINSRAQEVTKDLFSLKKEKKPQKSYKKKEQNVAESWFCFLCQEDRRDDMRLCRVCSRYVHEACVGLTKDDKEEFICPLCA